MNHYEELDVPYARVGGEELVLRVTRPRGQGDGPFPVLLDFHGGAWTHFDHRVDLAWCRELARAGVLCASVQFRLAPQHPWPAFLADARAALRWITGHGATLDADVTRLGTIGGSTGGYLSILLALCPRQEGEPITAALDTPDDLEPAMPRAAIGFYPILDVVGRYRMVQQASFSPAAHWLRERLGPERRPPGYQLPAPIDRLERLYALKHSPLGGLPGGLANRAIGLASRVPFVRLAVYEGLLEAHEGAFGSVEVMHEASPLARVEEGRVQQLPPLLILQGRDDINVLPEMAHAFAAAYRGRGGQVEVELPKGFPHAFASVPSPQSDVAIARSLQFLREHGLLTRVADGGPS